MAVNVGDVVHILSWDTLNGYSAEEYVLTEISADHITLKHVSTYRNKQRYPGHGQTEQRPLRYLEYFSISLAERMREQKESIDWLVANLGGKQSTPESHLLRDRRGT
jgi:hypothetical protein